MGDFNVVRNKSERKGHTFNHSVSAKFNQFINSNHLIDLKSTDKLFTWSNLKYSPSCVCLDRFMCSISWENEFSYCLNKSLSRYQSDHNAIMLIIDNNTNNQHTYIIKWDKNRINQEGFSDLLISWWQSQHLEIRDIVNSWKIKMQIFRKK
jgi:hypothetical protein